MKFEFVEFYPIKNNKNRRALGTVHIYAIDCGLDIRGILATKQGKGIYFNFPHYNAKDQETGEDVRYPHIRWTNEKTNQEMWDFLRNEVRPIILENLRKNESKAESKE